MTKRSVWWSWILGVLLVGCANAKADFHALVSGGMGVLVAAQNNPALVEEAKAALVLASDKALSPTDQAIVNQALAHVTVGNLGNAQALLAPLVAASAP